MKIILMALLFAAPVVAQMDHEHHMHHAQSPYAANTANAVKALSPEQLDAYRNGTGMGLAIPAELNGYPGPRHILDLADQLHLTADQRSRVQAIFDPMHAGAVRIGAEIVELETKLDRGFAAKTMTSAQLRSMTTRIAELQGRLRFVHLNAHLAAKDVLTTEQVAQYAKLRGY